MHQQQMKLKLSVKEWLFLPSTMHHDSLGMTTIRFYSTSEVKEAPPSQQKAFCLIINKVVRLVQHTVWTRIYFFLYYSVQTVEGCISKVEKMRRIKFFLFLWSGAPLPKLGQWKQA